MISISMAETNGDTVIEAVGSEISGCSSYPLSLPSQPPDIRNWFSSYEYESPEYSGLPDSFGCSPIPQVVESETEDICRSKDPPADEEKHLAFLSNGSIHYESCSQADIILLKKKHNIIQEFKGKSFRQCDDGDGINGDLSRTNGIPIKINEQSPKRLSAKLEHKERSSDPEDPRRANLVDFEVGHEAPGDVELSPRWNIVTDGFISTRNKEKMKGLGGNLPSKLMPITDSDDLPTNKGKVGVVALRSLPDGSSFFSERSESGKSSEYESFLKIQNPQEEFREKSLSKPDENDGSADPILSGINGSLFKDQERAAEVQPEENKGREWLDGKGRRRVVESDIKSKVADEICQAKQLFLRCNDKEPREDGATGGFVSITNKENSRENCRSFPYKSIPTMDYKDMAANNVVKLRGSREHLMSVDRALQDNNGDLADIEQAQAGKRSILADRTNFQVGAAAVAPEIAGKWQCPRKSKPYMGPPMKQLRLERWVHRSNSAIPSDN